MDKLKHVKNIRHSSEYLLNGEHIIVDYIGDFGVAHNSAGEIIMMKNGNDLLKINLDKLMDKDKNYAKITFHSASDKNNIPEEGSIEIFKTRDE